MLTIFRESPQSCSIGLYCSHVMFRYLLLLLLLLLLVVVVVVVVVVLLLLHYVRYGYVEKRPENLYWRRHCIHDFNKK